MRAAVVIAALDLRRRLVDRSALVTAFFAPFVLASIMGLAFGGSPTGQIKVAVADVDNTAVSRAYLDATLASMSLGPTVAVERLDDAARAHALYASNRVAAAIVLDRGATDRIAAGAVPPLTIDSGGGRPVGETITDAFMVAVRLRHAQQQALGAVPPGGAPTRLVDGAVHREPKSPLGYFAPSVAIVFLFLSVGAAANSIRAERATGTMVRMQAAPVGLRAVVAGKTLSIGALMLLSVLALWGATTLVWGAAWGAPAGVLLLSVASVAAIGALGLFVTVSARTEAMAQSAAAALAFVLGILGGNFFPPGSLPPFFERLSLLTPNGWALDGFTTLSLDGGSVGDVLRPVIVLFAIAAVVGALALARFRSAVASA
jgi:ABC-2 type transport system permease protein